MEAGHCLALRVIMHELQRSTIAVALRQLPALCYKMDTSSPALRLTTAITIVSQMHQTPRDHVIDTINRRLCVRCDFVHDGAALALIIPRRAGCIITMCRCGCLLTTKVTALQGRQPHIRSCP